MLILFILLSSIVGVACGAALGYETRDLSEQPTGWRPWAVFAGVTVVVVICCALVEMISETKTLTGPVKTMGLLVGAVAFAVALFVMRRRR
jgi:hypothetical protein